jgi:hypothetical protein
VAQSLYKKLYYMTALIGMDINVDPTWSVSDMRMALLSKLMSKGIFSIPTDPFVCYGVMAHALRNVPMSQIDDNLEDINEDFGEGDTLDFNPFGTLMEKIPFVGRLFD